MTRQTTSRSARIIAARGIRVAAVQEAAKAELSEAYKEIAASMESHRYSRDNDQNIKRFERKIGAL